MADATRPLPSLDEPDTAPFWTATKQHTLQYPVCDDCDTVVFYPRNFCPACMSSRLTWKTSKGEGTVYSFSIVRLSRDPFFGGKTPYAIVLVDLDEGFRMLSNMTGVEDVVSNVKVGQRVRVEWEDHEGMSIPLFTPV